MAESNIRFDVPGTFVTSPAKTTSLRAALPVGVSLTLALTGSIDARTAAAGDAVSATVVNAVRVTGSKEVLVPAGAIALGRILQMRQEYRSEQFLVALHFNALEIQGAVSPLSLRFDRELVTGRRTRGGFAIGATEFSPPAPASKERGGLFMFSVRGGRYVIPAGFQSRWITVAP